MEHTIKEVIVLQRTANEALEKSVVALEDLHLALIGGGVGETVDY